MHWSVSGHVATGSASELVNVCLCLSLEMLYPPPYFTVILDDNLFQPLPLVPHYCLIISLTPCSSACVVLVET